MILNESIQRFITEHHVDTFGAAQVGSNGVMLKFTLAYYDAYALLAISKRNILFLDEDVMKEVKIHKGKLHFNISYDINYDVFELEGIIYGVPLQKCIRVVNSVKKILSKYNLGSTISNFTHNKVTYTSVQLTKFFS